MSKILLLDKGVCYNSRQYIPMIIKVFYSWGGEMSRLVAKEVYDWLPLVLQSVKGFFSPEDINKGSEWNNKIKNELETSQIGLFFMTKANLSSRWMMYEAGSLPKNGKGVHVCPILLNIENADMEGPLSMFQTTKYQKDDFLRLVKSINLLAGEEMVPEDILTKSFEKFWPELNEKVFPILQAEPRAEEIRQETGMVKEILEIVRKMQQEKNKPTNQDLVKELVLAVSSIDQQLVRLRPGGIYGRFDRVLDITRALCIENGCIELYADLFQRGENISKS